MQGLGTGGAAQFFRAYINNPNMSTADFLYQTQPASAANILANNGNLYAGQTLQGTVNRFAANLGAAPSGSSGVGSLYSGIVSPFSVDTNTYGGVSTGGVSSPFSGVSNFSSTPGVGSTQSASYGQPIQYSQQSQNSQQSQTNSLNSNGATQTTSTTGATTVSPGQTGAAVAQIIAQPKTVRRGTSVTVAWSSVGMSNASPCHVYENNSTQVANTNEGSRLVTTSTTGTLTFSLICTAQGTSATVQNTYSVVVQ